MARPDKVPLIAFAIHYASQLAFFQRDFAMLLSVDLEGVIFAEAPNFRLVGGGFVVSRMSKYVA